jgi:hypothetical protein
VLNWSPLHAALGLRPEQLGWSHIEHAVANSVAEADDLDWKSALPNTDVAESREEFAKDVAALANTRGGVIVFGVAEDRGRGTAKAVTPVDISERAQAKLRSTAANLVHPFVSGLDIVPVMANEGDASGVLVVVVPASPDAPHLLGGQDKFGCPFRDGPTTRWMRERDLEAAYRERFGRRTDERQQLADSFDDLTDRLDLDQLWIAGVARLRSGNHAVATPPDRKAIVATLQAALERSDALVSRDRFGRANHIRDLDSGALNPRVGLRRWLATTPGDGNPDERAKLVHVELHHDGAIAFAAAMDGWYAPVIEGVHQLVTQFAESFCADLIALIDAVASRSGYPQRYAVEVALLRSDPTKPIAALSNHRVGTLTLNSIEVLAGSRYVRNFRKVGSEVVAPSEDEMLVDAIRSIALDVLGQFGVGRLHTIPPSE